MIGYSSFTSAIVYSITSSAGAGGTISPLGVVNVSSGDSQTFTMTPSASYYYLLNVFVDNVSIGAVSNYTFTHVSEDHTISAEFTLYPPIAWRYINSSAGPGGSIYPLGLLALTPQTKNQTYILIPDESYSIGDVFVDNVSKGPVSSWTFGGTGDHTIYATFGIAPTTSDDYDAVKEAICQNTNQTIKLIPQCSGGCNWTRYCTDKDCSPTNGTDYAGSVTIGPGKTYFRYQSKSNVGILQNVVERFFLVDPSCYSNPNLHLVNGNENQINSSNYNVIFTPTFSGTKQFSIRETNSEDDLPPNSGVIALGSYLEILAPGWDQNITNGTIELKFNENVVNSIGLNRSSLRLWFYNPGSGWQIVDSPTGGIYEDNSFVWANTNHFSVWGIFGSMPQQESQPPSSGGSSGGNSGGGSGGSGGSSCKTTWDCSDWGQCIDGQQVRNCVKENPRCSAGTKPSEKRDCTIQQLSTPFNQTEMFNTNASSNSSKLNISEGPMSVSVPVKTIDFGKWAILAVAAGAIVGVLISRGIKKRRRK